MRAYYDNLCINCNSRISDDRLIGVCRNCIDTLDSNLFKLDEIERFEKLRLILKNNNKLKELENYSYFYDKLKEFKNFFRKVIGQDLWSLQEIWARRLLLNKSFLINAPTGIGKTTIGIVYSLYLSLQKKRSYLIVPTAILVQNIYERLITIYDKIKPGYDRDEILFYVSSMKEKEKKKVIEKLKESKFKIFISTDKFLIKNYELFFSKFDFVFVDDIDSFLKSSRNIDKVCYVLGFSKDIIEKTLRIPDLLLKSLKVKDKKSIINEVDNIRKEIEEFKRKNKIAMLVVSGATTKTSESKRTILFKELLGFQLGNKPSLIRNILDCYIFARDVEQQILNLINKFGSGCLIFVPMDLGKEYAKKITDFLNRNGISACMYEEVNESLIQKFKNGEYFCLVGIASFKSPLARGLDLPETVRYVIFAGVPRFRVPLHYDTFSPIKLLAIIKNIYPFLEEEDKTKALEIAKELSKILRTDEKTIERLKEGNYKTNFEKFVFHIINNARGFIKQVVNKKLLEKIKNDDFTLLEEKDGELSLIISDSTGYIQASGRASRLFAYGLSHGISFLLVDNMKAFNGLQRKLKYIFDDFVFYEYDENKVVEYFKKIDKDRKIMRDIHKGKIDNIKKDLIKTVLLIVESPTKAKTIAKFFGKPSVRRIHGLNVYEISIGEYILNIIASMGHIYELTLSNEGIYGIIKEKDNFYPIYTFIKKCNNCGHQFTYFDYCPICKSTNITSKEKIVNALRDLAIESNEIFIATDPDSEGEKIAYDIFISLYPFNKNIHRLEFHEITRRAILNAIENKKKLNEKLVEAQIVRRIEDRWLGFLLSEKVKNYFRKKNLSAGRVQSPVLNWIAERTKNAKKKKKVLFVKVQNLLLNIEDIDIKEKEINEERAKIKIELEEKYEKEEKPLPPYTTDTLLRDASLYLKFDVSKTMQIAQELFESGLITYHRTDSTTVSTHGINIAKEYIKSINETLFKPRNYAKEGAHECIRPTKPYDINKLRELILSEIINIKLSKDHFRLYDLIFKRFIASQMENVKLLYGRFNFTLYVNDNSFSIKKEVPLKIVKHGFDLILPVKTFEINEGIFNADALYLKKIPIQYPYREGEIISEMKEKEIGRPSTYSKILTTLLNRKYIKKMNEYVICTNLGFKVNWFLNKYYLNLVSEEVTRKLQKTMDDIEKGKIKYMDVLRSLYEEINHIK